MAPTNPDAATKTPAPAPQAVNGRQLADLFERALDAAAPGPLASLIRSQKGLEEGYAALRSGQMTDCRSLVAKTLAAAEKAGVQRPGEGLAELGQGLLYSFRERYETRPPASWSLWSLFANLGDPGWPQRPARNPEAAENAPPFYLPLKRNPLFRNQYVALELIGEYFDAAALENNEHAPYNTRHVYLAGPPGIGKTAVAAEYAHLGRGLYPGGVYWLQVDVQLTQHFKNLADLLGLELDADISEQRLKNRVLGALNSLPSKLVILDGLPDVGSLDIFKLSNADILVTTGMDIASRVDPVVWLEPPREDEALGVLLAYAGQEGAALDQEDQEALYALGLGGDFRLVNMELLGRLAWGRDLAAFAGEFEEALAALPDSVHPYLRPGAAGLLMARARFSQQALTSLVGVCCFMDPKYLYLNYLAICMEKDEAEVEAWLNELAELGLVKLRAPGIYTMEDTLQEAAMALGWGDGKAAIVAGMLESRIHWVVHQSIRGRGIKLLPHLLKLSSLDEEALTRGGLAQKNFLSLETLKGMADFLRIRGFYSPAEVLFKSWLRQVKTGRGETHPDYAAVLANLGAALRSQQKIPEAKAAYRRLLNLTEATVGRRHPQYAAYLNNLATILRWERRYDEAETLLRQALEIDEKTGGKNTLAYGVHLHNLAMVLRRQGRFMECERLLRAVLEITRTLAGEDSALYASALGVLARLMLSFSRFSEAESLFGRAVEICRQTLGTDHPEYAANLNSLAVAIYGQGRYDEALEVSRQVLGIFEKSLAEANPDYAMILSNLGRVIGQDHEKKDLVEVALQVLKIDENALSSLSHEEYALALANLAQVLNFHGMHQEAGEILRKVLEIEERTLGAEHYKYAKHTADLAMVLFAQGLYTQAEETARQAIHIEEKNVGEHHPRYGMLLNTLAKILTAKGYYAEAEVLYCRAMKIIDNTVGQLHPGYATCLSNLGMVYRAQGRLAEAEEVCRRALEIDHQTIGASHAEHATTLNNLALILHDLERHAEAEELFRQVLEIKARTSGEDSPEYANCLNNLALVLHQRGRYAEAEGLYDRALAIDLLTLTANHPQYATHLSNLGGALFKLDKSRQAEEALRRALEISQRALGPKHPQTKKIKENLTRFLKLGNRSPDPPAFWPTKA